MPALIPKAFTEQQEPFLWVCSDCDKPFTAVRLPNRETMANVHVINRDFAVHCRRCHPKAVVVALPHGEGHKGTLIDTLFGWLRTVLVD